MKNCCIIFLLSIIISLTALGFSGREVKSDLQTGTSEYLRIHIRADSNEDKAQAVKYLVRDDVVEFLTPHVASYLTKAQAIEGIREILPQIEKVAKETLLRRGFSYGARASVRTETFPVRVYDGYTLPAGEYSALFIELGSGKGDNWWCVVYPPLCFSSTSSKNVVYKSKILEIIRRFRNG